MQEEQAKADPTDAAQDATDTTDKTLHELKVEILSLWGLAMLQHGRLKVNFVERLGSLEVGANAEAASSELSLQAEDLLVASGRKFRDTLLIQPQSARALFNWVSTAARTTCFVQEVIAVPHGELTEVGFSLAGACIVFSCTPTGSIRCSTNRCSAALLGT